MIEKEIRSVLLALLVAIASGPVVGITATASGAIDTTVGIGTANEAPLADAGLDQTVVTNETVLLDAGGSTDPDGDITSFGWEITAPDGSSVVPDCPTCERTTFVPVQAGEYEVGLEVTDDDGETRTDVLFVTVERADGPSISLEGPSSATQDDQERYRASVDAGESRLDGVIWRVGTDVVARENLSGQHGEPQLRLTFDDVGQFEVSATAVDEAGRDASAAVDVAVASDEDGSPDLVDPDPENVAPTVTVDGPDLVEPGDYEEFTAVASDPDGVIVDHEWSNAENTVMTDRTRAGHHFTEGSGRLVPITVTVEDDDGATATDTTVVKINRTAAEDENQPPEVTIDGPETVEACEETEVSLTAEADDPDGDSIDSYTWSGVDSSSSAQAELTVNSDDSPEVSISVEVEDEYQQTNTSVHTLNISCTQERNNYRIENLDLEGWRNVGWFGDTRDGFFSGTETLQNVRRVNFRVALQNPRAESLWIKWSLGDGSVRWTKTGAENSIDQEITHHYDASDSSEKLIVTISIYRNKGDSSAIEEVSKVSNIEGQRHDTSLNVYLDSDQTEVEEGDTIRFSIKGSQPDYNKYWIDFHDGTIEELDLELGIDEVKTLRHSFDSPGVYMVSLTQKRCESCDKKEVDQIRIVVERTYSVYEWYDKDTETNSESKQLWSDPGPGWEWENHIRTTERATGETTVQPAQMPSPPRGDGYYWKKVDEFTRFGWPHEEYEKYETATLNEYEKTTTDTVRGDTRQSLDRPPSSTVYENSLSSREYECSDGNAPLHDQAC